MSRIFRSPVLDTHMQSFIDKVFDREDFRETPPAGGEYENCVFKNCDFSGTDLSEIIFIECEFVNSNLSLAKLPKTAFRDVMFRDCKMLGLHFEQCNDFGLAFSFEKCTLDHSSFYRMKLKQTSFRNTHLLEVDFTECDLTGSVFEHCDLTGAMFEHTVLEKADLRTSFNYSIDPENNRIKKARFSLSEVHGLLDKYDIAIE